MIDRANALFPPIHIEDVANCLTLCVDMEEHLYALLGVILEQSPKDTLPFHLAELGRAVSGSLQDFAGMSLTDGHSSAISLDSWLVGLRSSVEVHARLTVLMEQIRNASPGGLGAAHLAEMGRIAALGMHDFASSVLSQLEHGGLLK